MPLINASEAHSIMIRMGLSISYPTALKFLKESGLSCQPTGRYGQVLVDKEGLEKKLEETQGRVGKNLLPLKQKRGRKVGNGKREK